jgi:hypothetical protein
MNKPELFNESYRATYCPESNKLHLYVGRVPRPEYDALRAEGWTSTPKQSEAGQGEFAATWTPSRRDTAISYAGIIEDEDASPAERAADRAERFSGYRDKRTDEATGHADRYDAGPQAHGFQSQARAERSAARHDRIADRAGDAWSKAEYWTRRTAGVISNALYKSTPGVRMGRVKELEAGIRKAEKNRAEYVERRQMWLDCAAITDPEKFAERVELLAGATSSGYDYKHPRPELVTNSHIRETGSSLWTLLKMDGGKYGPPITAAEAVEMYLAENGELSAEGDWLTHYRMRLAYEEQMLEAAGGRAGDVEMIPGGWICASRRRLAGQWLQIRKVNKSNASGRVVSVEVLAMQDTRYNNETRTYDRALAPVLMNVERDDPDAYRAPTPEELIAFEASMKAEKAKRKASAPVKPSLINPTDADAERLVAMWNAARLADHEKKNTYSSPEARAMHTKQFKPCEVRRIRQETYSDASKGAYARAETQPLCSLGRLAERNVFYDYSGQAERAKARGPALCLIRTTGFDPVSVIILTDKPQKPLPASVWEAYTPAAVEAQTVNA